MPVIIKASLTWLVAYMAFSSLLRTDRELSRVYVIVAFIITTTMFISWRYILSKIVSIKSIARRLRQRILFVGWSEHAMSLARAIVADGRLQYEVAGYVPTGRGQKPDRSSVFVRRLGSPDCITDVLQDQEIDMVILARA